mmetsp:Transcript_31013/g.68116  ORF Transcript_31013/g.68116 Transcript_31013/m.68116 type:complete len:322 (-) Transcript_31013:152-1117(-)
MDQTLKAEGQRSPATTNSNQHNAEPASGIGAPAEAVKRPPWLDCHRAASRPLAVNMNVERPKNPHLQLPLVAVPPLQHLRSTAPNKRLNVLRGSRLGLGLLLVFHLLPDVAPDEVREPTGPVVKRNHDMIDLCDVAATTPSCLTSAQDHPVERTVVQRRVDNILAVQLNDLGVLQMAIENPGLHVQGQKRRDVGTALHAAFHGRLDNPVVHPSISQHHASHLDSLTQGQHPLHVTIWNQHHACDPRAGHIFLHPLLCQLDGFHVGQIQGMEEAPQQKDNDCMNLRSFFLQQSYSGNHANPLIVLGFGLPGSGLLSASLLRV